MWTCTTCLLTIQESLRVTHLAGVQHASNSTAQGNTRTQVKLSKGPAGSPAMTPSEWKCPACHISMHENSKESHLAGRAHLKKVGASSGGTGGSNGMDISSISPQSQPTQELAAAVRWTCSVCHITMHQDSRRSHLAGKAHDKKLMGDGDSGDGAGSTKKKTKALDKGKSLPLHPGGPDDSDDPDDESGSDSYYSNGISREDAAHLLWEIDTQWGMIPGGGAYKESNHYYGPGIHDYY